jgi:2-oxoglutarate ferredoxin oxidoreductase subunit beta
MSTATPTLTPKDFKSDQEVKWCPGCGDYSILTQIQKILPETGIPREKMVFVSGIGCSSRLPYYMATYGFHSIHGRAPAIATGVKLANPELDVWVMTGDGDGLSIGGNHVLHTIRRNVGVKIVLFNNRIYGLTKGQASPTSEFGQKTKSTPYGSIDQPMHPITVALGAEITFVARCVDTDVTGAQEVFRRAAAHRGTAFVEVYQDCKVYNKGAYNYATDRVSRLEHLVYLEHGKPLIFGKDRNKGIRLRGTTPEIVTLGNGVSESELLVHDEQSPEPTLAFLLSRMRYPDMPEPVGVFRAVTEPAYEQLVMDQIEQVRKKLGPPSVDKLLNEGDVWEVK